MDSRGPVREEVFRDLLEHGPDLLCLANADGYFLWLSDAWEETLGWSRAELSGRPFIDFVHPDDVPRTAEKAAAMSAIGEDAVRFENRYRTRDGSYRWLQWNAKVGPEGVIFAQARDIHEQKTAELERAEQLRTLEMAERLAGVTRWRVDLTSGRLEWSPGVYVIYGRDPESYTPELDSAIEGYHPDDRAMVASLVERAIAEREGFAFTARIIQPNGEVREVHSQGVPEVGRNGEVTALFGIFRDITEAQRLQETLRRSERLVSLGTMAAGVAHEINNPLSYLLGNLQIVAEELDDVAAVLPTGRFAEVREMIDDAVSGAHRIEKIVTGVRSFSRVGDSHPVRVQVDTAVEAALAIADHQVRLKAGLDVRVDPDAAVRIDETQFVQVLVNLLVNAAQALPEGHAREHRITLDGQVAGDEVRLRVSDTGPGIPRDIRERIFDPFFTTKPVGKGTGLGLSICHSIITHAGGRLELEEVSSGASFLVTLPFAATTKGRAGQSEAEALEATAPDDRPRLLVVDDEPHLLSMLERGLRRQFRVEVVLSGRAAIRSILDGEAFDLILCDVMMPDISGFEVLAEIERKRPELLPRVLFATGGTLDPGARGRLESRGIPILRKPFDMPRLRRLLASRLGDALSPSDAGP